MSSEDQSQVIRQVSNSSLLGHLAGLKDVVCPLLQIRDEGKYAQRVWLEGKGSQNTENEGWRLQSSLELQRPSERELQRPPDLLDPHVRSLHNMFKNSSQR